MPMIDVNGTSLFYTDEGPKSAPALVMSHSLFFDHTMFAHQAERFSETMRVVRYDHRGQGQSAPTDMESVDMDTLAEDAAEFIRALELAPCVFVGNSMGGFVALRLAARHPELVRGCVVLGTSAEQEYQLEAFAPLVAAMSEHGTQPVIDTLMHIMFGDTILADESRADIVGHWRDRMLALDQSIGRSAHGVIHRASVLGEVATTTVPLLVLAGEEDHAYEVALSKNIAQAAPHGRMHVVARSGHSVALEEHEAANAHIADFLATL